MIPVLQAMIWIRDSISRPTDAAPSICSFPHTQTYTRSGLQVHSGFEAITLKNVQANHQHMWFIDNYQLFTVINKNTTSKFFYLLCQTTYTAFAASVFITCFSLKAAWSSLSSQVEHLEI